MLNKAIFLDSDGVLNKALVIDGKPKAPTSLSLLEIPDEVKPALDQLKQAGFILICVTNKPDVERGLMTKQDVEEIYEKIRNDLPLDDIFICYSEFSNCYKPKPKMILDAAKKYQIDLNISYMIGDRWSDIKAGQNAGCKTIWIDRHYPVNIKPDPPADCTVESLQSAVEWILKNSKPL